DWGAGGVGTVTYPLVIMNLQNFLIGEPVPKVDELTRLELDRLWKDLGERDGVLAHRIILKLAAVPKKSLPYFKEHLRSDDFKLDNRKTETLVKSFRDGDEAEREKAAKDLEQLGLPAEPALRRALTKKMSASEEQRIKLLLQKLATEGPTPQQW